MHKNIFCITVWKEAVNETRLLRNSSVTWSSSEAVFTLCTYPKWKYTIEIPKLRRVLKTKDAWFQMVSIKIHNLFPFFNEKESTFKGRTLLLWVILAY